MEGPMRSLVRWFCWLILLLVVICVVCLIIRRPIAEFSLGHSLKTSVTMSSLDLMPGEATFTNLYVASPGHSRMATALVVREGEIELASWMKALHNPVELSRVELRGVRINFDFPKGPSLTDGNWADLMKNAEKSSSRVIKIHKFILRDVEVSMMGPNGVVTTMPPIREIKLSNVDTSKGLEGNHLAGLLIHAIFMNVASFEQLIPNLPVIGSPLAEGLGQGAELLQKTGSGLQQAGDAIKSGLDGIFQGSK